MMRILVCLLCLFTSFSGAAQVLLRGSVQDSNGEHLPQAHLVVTPDSITTTADVNGNFSVRLKSGSKTIQVSYVGYKVYSVTLHLRSDTTIHISMQGDASELQEVVITGERNYQQEIFAQNRTSTHVLTKDDINSIPVLGGEADVIKTLQLLPGTLRGVEGTSDLFVRGGAADQNLVLLDGAPIYNTSHLFGFLSVFNPDILDNVEAINGGFPAEYGGRLSSILDVETVSAMRSKTRVSGDIGLISSRLMIEQPLVKNKMSVWVAARRTYIDQVVKMVGEELPYFFYDINGKLIYRPTADDVIEISHYGGEDVLDLFRDRNNDGDGFLTQFTSGNSSQSVQWGHRFNERYSTNLSAYRSSYKYNIRNTFEENQLVALSDIVDYGAHFTVTRDSLGTGTLKGGIEWVSHAVSPNVINAAGTVSEFIESSTTSAKRANEISIHGEYEWKPVSGLTVNGGLRLSNAFVSGKTYSLPEPRLSARYALTDKSALKMSYSRMAQYIHRISNSAVSAPTDIWYPVTDSIKPQASHQVALAWQKSMNDGSFYMSLEGYYKSMSNLIGYEEGTNLFFNNDFESKLIQGKGRSYGLEFLLRKDEGKLTGWISYTLSWSWRKYDEIDAGWFPARYDRRHNGAIVMQYALSKRWSVSAVWEFISGSRFTPVIGQYVVTAPSLTGVDLIPVFSEINAVKLADSHRLDLGLKFKNKPGRKFQWHWFAGVYNVYNRANPVGINIEQNEDDGSLRYTQPGLFGLLPFISYGFKF